MIFPKDLSKHISGVYSILCLKNGKRYVGSAHSLLNRFRQHVSQLGLGQHHGVRLQRAWIKHGPESFKFEVLEVIPDKSQLLIREQFFIDLLSAFGSSGYNSAPRAGSMAGFKMSINTKKRMSARKKIDGPPLQFIEAGKVSWIGRSHTPEARAKMSAAKKGKPLSQAAWDAARVANLGHNRKHSEETKAKISAATKGRSNSDRNRAAVSAATKGVKWTPERIAKRTATLKRNREAAMVEFS